MKPADSAPFLLPFLFDRLKSHLRRVLGQAIRQSLRKDYSSNNFIVDSNFKRLNAECTHSCELPRFIERRGKNRNGVGRRCRKRHGAINVEQKPTLRTPLMRSSRRTFVRPGLPVTQPQDRVDEASAMELRLHSRTSWDKIRGPSNPQYGQGSQGNTTKDRRAIRSPIEVTDPFVTIARRVYQPLGSHCSHHSKEKQTVPGRQYAAAVRRKFAATWHRPITLSSAKMLLVCVIH